MRNIFACFVGFILFTLLLFVQGAVAEVFVANEKVIKISMNNTKFLAGNFLSEDRKKLYQLYNERSSIVRRIEYLQRTGKPKIEEKNIYYIKLSFYPEDIQKQLISLIKELSDFDNEIVEIKRANALRLIKESQTRKEKKLENKQIQFINNVKQVKLPLFVIPNSYLERHKRYQGLFSKYKNNITKLPQLPELK